MMLSIFSCAFGHFIIFRDMFIQSISPFFDWVVFLLLSSLILMQVPYQISYLQIFYPILWIVFSLYWWCSLKYKRLQFWWCPNYFFFCCLCFWCHILKNHMCLVVLAPIFRSLIHFCMWCIIGVQLHFLACVYPIVQAPVVERLNFPVNSVGTLMEK